MRSFNETIPPPVRRRAVARKLAMKRAIRGAAKASTVLAGARVAATNVKLGAKLARATVNVARRHPVGVGLLALGTLWVLSHSSRPHKH